MVSFFRIWRKVFSAWETPETTGQQVARGGAILFFGRFLAKGLQFIRTVIIARLLFPDDIGLFALASLGLGTISIFVPGGFNSAIVQEKEDVKKYLNSAWTANVIRGMTIAVAVFFSAPYIASFFNNDALTLLIRAVALLALIEGLENVGIVLFQKNLAWNKQFLYDVLGTLVQILAIIVFALSLQNVWALVWGTIIGRSTFVILSYVLHPYRPRFEFDIAKIRYLFRFGRWVALIGIISFLVTRGDSLVIGRLLSPSDLAFYQMAFALGLLPAVELVKSLGSLLFPLYAKIQEDRERLKSAFVRISKLILVFMVPASIGIFVLAEEIVTYVYGSRWLPMVPVLYVVVGFGFIKSFEYLISPLFLGIGKPRISVVVMIIQAMVLFSVVIPLTNAYGIIGTAWATLLSLVVAQSIYIVRLSKEINFNPIASLGHVTMPLIASVAMAVSVFYLGQVWRIGHQITLLSHILVGALVYFAVLLAIDKLFGNKIYHSFLWIKQNI